MIRRTRLALAGAAFLAVCTTAQAAPVFINILTGGTSGVYYPVGVGLSQIYSHGIEGSKTSVQATKASVENLNLVQADRGELAAGTFGTACCHGSLLHSERVNAYQTSPCSVPGKGSPSQAAVRA